MSTASSGPGSYWTFASGTTTGGPYYPENPQDHVLYKPLEELKDEIAHDLLEIRVKIRYSTTIQLTEEIQLRRKIAERLYDYFYDSDPADVDKLAELIEFKEWPQDFGVPDSLSINGKLEGPTLLILLRPKPLAIPEIIKVERTKRLKKIKVHNDSRHSIKGLSHIHSMKARRKL